MEAQATRIGCDNLVFAPLTADDGTTLSYGTIVALPGVMKLNVNPNPSQETIFYDDGPGETASTLGKIEVEIDKNALSTAEKAALLGHGIDSNGALISGAADTPPWVAIGYRTLKSNGSYRYVWLYKGKFMEPEENNETKGDSINFQNDTIKGQFAKVNKVYTVDGKPVKPWKTEIDEDDAGVSETAISNWFTAVYFPSVGTIAPTLTVVVAEGTVSGSTKATITGAATASFAAGLGTSSDNPVYVGATPRVTTAYTSGEDITGASVGDYLYVYDLDAEGKVVKFFEKCLTADDILA